MHSTPNNSSDWQTALKEAITDSGDLLQLLGLSGHYPPETLAHFQQFPLLVPRGFVARMQKGNPQDPLLLQVLPQAQEYTKIAGFGADPLQEQQFNPVPGLLHKYANRVLLTAAPVCPIHCRYCFRRHFPYAENSPGQFGWQAALDYIAERPQINEVILSGGDPLMLKDSVLQRLIDKIAAIPSVQRLRFHTRMPITVPERITSQFLQLCNTRLQTVVVVHCNHPNEIDINVATAMQKLRQANITLFNQAVLLKDINDKVETLAALSEKLFSIGVIPYYLHLLDKVEGAAHFEVPEVIAKQLMEKLKTQLPGYLVPKLVREEAKALSKREVLASSVVESG